MKKVGVLLFVFAILLFSAKAEINLNSFESANYNLGEKVKLEGSVASLDGIIGNLEVNSVCANSSKQVYLALMEANINNPYEFSQEFPVKESMLGNCYFQLNLKTEDGNVVETKNSEEFVVTRELRIDAELDVLSQQPGKDITINGAVRNANGIRVGGGSVVFTLNGKLYSSGLSDGAFGYKIAIPSDMDSGTQMIDIQARDLLGNEGKGNVSFKVLSIAKGLVIDLDKESYNPNEEVVVKTILNDQSGKNLEGSTKIQLYDPNEDKELTKIIENDKEFSIPLSSFALPGTWTLEAEGNEFKVIKKFFVDEIKSKEVVLKGNVLFVTNTGNVNYEDPIEIVLKDENGEEYQVMKKSSLKPNQTISIDLNNQVPGGEYEVDVGGNLITGNVVIEGSALGSLKGSKSIGYIALVFVFLFLILIVVTKGRKKMSKRETARDRGRRILNEKPVVRSEDKVISKHQKADLDYMVNQVKQNNPVNNRQNNPINKQKDDNRASPFDIFN